MDNLSNGIDCESVSAGAFEAKKVQSQPPSGVEKARCHHWLERRGELWGRDRDEQRAPTADESSDDLLSQGTGHACYHEEASKLRESVEVLDSV